MTSLRKLSIVLLVAAALLSFASMPGQAQTLTVSCNSTSFPSAMNSGSFYTLSCNASGGTAPYTWNLNGTLPYGMISNSSLNELVVSGAPSTTIPTYNFFYTVTDGSSPQRAGQTPTYSGTVSTGGGGTGGIIITGISPQTITAGVAATLTVTGTGFSTSSLVFYNGIQEPTTFTNSTSLTATIPASQVNAGTATVQVHDGANLSNSINVTVTANTGIVISSISPSTVPANTTVTLTFTGANFAPGQLISFSGANTSLQVPSGTGSTSFSLIVPSNVLTIPGIVNVQVGNSAAYQLTVTSSGTNSLTVTCNPSSGPASLNVFFSQTCQVGTGGTSPYTWTVSGLPSGLTQSSPNGAGSITFSGTPTVSGPYSYTVQVIDNSATRLSGSVTIAGTISSLGGGGYNITSLAPASAAAGSQATALTVFGNGFSNSSLVYFNGFQLTTSYVSASQVSALIPANLLTTSGTATVTVITSGVSTNGLSFTIGSGTGSGSLTVSCTPGTGPSVIQIAYTTTCSVSGGVPPYNWPTPAGLPGYLTLSSSTGNSITIAGTPNSSAPYNYTVKVTDSSSPAQSGGLQFAGETNPTSSGTGSTTVTSISPTSVPLNSAATTLIVNGTGFIPANGSVSGSQVVFDGFAEPTTFVSASQLTAVIPANQFTFARAALVTVNTPGTAPSNGVTFIIGNGGTGGQFSINCNPGIGPSSPNSYYAATCGVNGGTGPYTWTISSGSLPAGLTLSSGGVTGGINGYTTFNGIYSYTVQVTDSSSPANVAQLTFAGETGTGGGTGGLSISQVSPSSVAPGSPATFITVTGVGFNTSSTINFSGTTLPTTFVNSGQLTATIPASLLTTAQNATITVSSSGITSNSLTFTIGTVVTTSISISCTPSAGPPSPGFSYLTTCSATGGKAPYFWSVVAGSLPSGLSLGASNGATVTITGTTFLNGQYAYTLQVTDSSTPVLTASYPFAGSLGSSTGSGFAGTITSLSPTSAMVGGGQFTLTVTGSQFQSGLSTVLWNQVVQLPTTFISSTQLSATVSASLLTAATTANITVQTSGLGTTNSVGFFVTSGPAVTVLPQSLSFTYGQGGTFPPAQILKITSSTGATGFSVTLNGVYNTTTWLASSPSSGAIPGSVNISVAPSGLPVGTYSGTVTITGFGVGGGTVVPVTLNVVGPPTLNASPLTLTLTSASGASPVTATVNVTSSDNTTVLPFTASAATNNGGTAWLTVSPASGSTPGTVTVTASAANLTPSTYSGSITLTSAGSLGSTKSIPVTFTVTAAPASLTVSPASLTFTYPQGAPIPAAQTLSVTASGNAAVGFTAAPAILTGGAWGLTVSPTSGSTPGTLSVTAPLPLSAGQYTGTVTITAPGATNSPVTVPVNVNVTSPASLTVAPQSLTFNVAADGGTPAPQSVSVFANGAVSFTTSVSTTTGSGWLSASKSGQAPGNVQVSVNPASLTAGQTYTGTVTVNAPSAIPSTIQIPVTVVFASSVTMLQIVPSPVLLSYSQGAAADVQTVTVLNGSATKINFTAQATSNTCGSWITLLTPGGSASATAPGSVGFTVNPSGLSAQTCRGSIVITDGNGNSATVPLYMAISAQSQSVLLSQTSMTFQSASGGSAPPAQTFQVLNPGSGSLSWNISALSLTGGSWLSVSSTSGSSQGLSQPGSPISVSVKPQGLAPGVYYGTVQVTSAGAANSPQAITVAYTVAGSGSNPSPQVSPAGVIITGTTGNSDTQTVTITNPSANMVTYTTSFGTDDGQNWLVASPVTGSLAAGGTSSISLSATLTNVGSGLRHGTLRLAFSDGSFQTVDVQLAISGSPSTSTAGVGTCGSSDVVLEFLSPAQGFSAPARSGVPLQVLAKDCTGNLLTSAGTGIDVLIGGSPMADVRLNYTGNGVWAGTWTPSGPAPQMSQVTLTARAAVLRGGSVATGAITATVALAPAVTGAPALISGVVNAASFMLPGLVAPGTMVSIFGSGLADAQMSVGSTPFPPTLQGAQFTLRGVPLSLFYVSDTQVNAVLPAGIAPNETDQILAVRDATQSTPVNLLVADTDPGLFSVNQQGNGQGAILLNGSSQVAGTATPATAGDYLSIFVAGLGAVNNTPADGSPSTGNSTTLIQPVVTIGGIQAVVAYSGLAPGEVGLYQVNVQIPAGVPTGNAVPVIITAGNAMSNTVTVAIH